MAKRAGRVGSGSGRVNWVTGQTGHESKTGHFKRVENGFGSIGLRVGSGWVGLTRIFYMKFFTFYFFIFFIKKTICICHLDSYATYYLM